MIIDNQHNLQKPWIIREEGQEDFEVDNEYAAFYIIQEASEAMMNDDLHHLRWVLESLERLARANNQYIRYPRTSELVRKRILKLEAEERKHYCHAFCWCPNKQ